MVAEAQRREIDAIRVASAGVRGNGEPTDPHVVDILAHHGIDLGRKRSRQLNMVTAASSDLILTMTTRHTRHVVSQYPEAASRTFAMRDFVHVVRRRPDDMSIEDWITKTSKAGADHGRYLVDGSDLDIADPIGEPRSVFAQLADEMVEMIGWIARCTGLFELEPQPPVPSGYRYRKLVGRRRAPARRTTSRSAEFDPEVELDLSAAAEPSSQPLQDE